MAAEASDVIKEVRSSAAFALTICVAWVLVAGSYQGYFRQRDAVRSLLAYVMLREAAQKGIFDKVDVDGAGKLFLLNREFGQKNWPCRFPDDQKQGTVRQKEKPIFVPGDQAYGPTSGRRFGYGISGIVPWSWGPLGPWDAQAPRGLIVGRAEAHASTEKATSHYCVKNTDDLIPLGDYVLSDTQYSEKMPDVAEGEQPRMRAPGQLFVGRAEEDGFRSETPFDWPIARALLITSGLVTPELDNLTLADPALQTLIAKYLAPDGSTTTVGGIAIPLKLAPLACFALLALTLCQLVGTWAALRTLRDTASADRSGWVFLNTSAGATGAVSFAAAVFLSFFVVSIPAFALYTTVMAAVSVKGWDRVFVSILACCLIATLLILALNITEQFRLRQLLKAEQDKAAP